MPVDHNEDLTSPASQDALAWVALAAYNTEQLRAGVVFEKFYGGLGSSIRIHITREEIPDDGTD